MRAEEFLIEGRSHPVIVVDVQPEYSGLLDGDDSPLFAEIIKFVNNQTGPVLMYINADETGVSRDNINDVISYWEDTVAEDNPDAETDNPFAPRSLINWRRFEIVDKGYGYFRGWMDSGIEPSIIIATIRELYQQKVIDTRDLEFPNSSERTPQQSLILGTIQELDNEPLTVNWANLAQLKRFNGAYLVGGGREECLREVELLMNAFNIRYKRIDSLVY